MRKLIIGCGYLGREVAKRWLDPGSRNGPCNDGPESGPSGKTDVFALTRSKTHAAVLQEMGVIPILGDVTQPETLTSLPAVDTVLYAVGFDRSSGLSQREVYVDGLRHTLEVLSSRVRTFLYISSTSVYGQTNGNWVDEESPCQPARENGQVCLEAEQLVWEAFPPTRQNPSPARPPGASVLRLAGLYGPGRLIGRVDSLKNGEPISGEPEAWINLIHRNDAASAVLAAERGPLGRTWLISDDHPLTRADFYRCLATAVGAPNPQFTGMGSGRTDGLNKRCRNVRMKSELQVSLQFPTVEMGIPHALQD